MSLYSCGFEGCSKKFKKPSLLELHENTHTNTRPFACKECDLRYFKNSHLKVHALRAHGCTEKRICKECNKTLASEEGLSRHKDVCGRVFTCNACSATFVRAKWFLNHSRACIGTVPLDNKKIALDTKTAQNAKPSLSTPSIEEMPQKSKNPGQTKEKDLIRCKICGKGFKLEKNCKFHESHAHNNLQYPCTHCSKVYNYKGSLTRHIQKIHSNINKS
ncbi:KRAB domain-containing zinc finger protein [Nematocida sp. AWRm79]|nr:KRAB domain-containing zinc finger protein [Nematocida sp. AWRm79]